MQPLKLLHNHFEKELPYIHKSRLKNVMDAALALTHGCRLSLTALGRSWSGKSTVRSNIKKVDRLLANQHLHVDRMGFYKVLNLEVTKAISTPCINVDWSCLSALNKLYVLRASMSLQGRSVVIYEEVYSKKNENHHPTHKKFLDNLKQVLPASVKPIIVTDAGFRGKWFSCVAKLGFDYVGRIRNKNLVCLEDNKWQLSQTFYEQATLKANYLGKGLLTKKNPVLCNFVLYKGIKKNRHQKNKDKSFNQGTNSKKYSKCWKEPWLLVTSLDASLLPAEKIVRIYRDRMQIEENFRDTKCSRYGFGLNNSGTKDNKRMEVLLLIGSIATFICWVSGLLVRRQGKASDFQAHSSKFSSVLSIIYLGREALKKRLKMTRKEFEKSLEELQKIAAALWETAL